ncbi:unnamed protein product [Angiostrongylus costaricensis]|uniref:Bestrophin homolog n=1 Tax=Angiostrongylus costaricensis TaxID=334426 RepID=A0A0R3PSH9_ANGCS|nr:unnamed protein product [Angiostrongylus costaricensis]
MPRRYKSIWILVRPFAQLVMGRTLRVERSVDARLSGTLGHILTYEFWPAAYHVVPLIVQFWTLVFAYLLRFCAIKRSAFKTFFAYLDIKLARNYYKLELTRHLNGPSSLAVQTPA